MKPPIVITGLTQHCEKVVEHYKDYECVWSTWKTEPQERLKFIKSHKNFTLTLCDPPKLKYGTHWGMYAWVNTLRGFRLLKRRGHDFGIKVRSDLLIDVDGFMPHTKKDHFNCLGWDTGSVGYLCDYYFSAPVNVMCDIMKECVKIDSESHAENILTYVLLSVLNFRKINYTLNEDTKFSFLRFNCTEEKYLQYVKNGTWFNDTNKCQISRNSVDYDYSIDYFPDNYNLTEKNGPQ